MDGFEDTICGVIPADADQVAALRAVRGGPSGDTSPPRDWAALQARAKALIAGDLRAAYAKHLAWYTGQLRAQVQAARSASSAHAQRRGLYNYRIRKMTTTNRTADDIHQLGLSEVKRIRARDGDGREEGRLRRAARRSSPTCAPTPNITPRRPRS